MATRRTVISAISLASTSLLTSCGTIIYPDRVSQKTRGNIDPAIAILDAVGLLFFLIPGVIAFAVDFGTGAIFFPEGKVHGDKEHTIFDDLSVVKPGEHLDQDAIERIAGERAGAGIDLSGDDVRVVELDHLNQFWTAYSRLANETAPI